MKKSNMLMPVMKAALLGKAGNAKRNIATGCVATLIGLSGIAQCMAGSSQEFNLPAMNFSDTLEISAAQAMNIPAVRSVEFASAPASQRKRISRRNILKAAPYFGDEKFLRLLNDEKTGVIYTSERLLLVNGLGNNEYLVVWETTDKRLITYLAQREKELAPSAARITVGQIKVCYKVAKEIVTIIQGIQTVKQVWETVCELRDSVENNYPDNEIHNCVTESTC